MPRKLPSWRFGYHDLNGPLTDEQITCLSTDFDLKRAALRSLSQDLGELLSRPRRGRSINSVFDSSKAGKQELARLRKDLATAIKAAKTVETRLSKLWIADDPTGEAVASHSQLASSAAAGLVALSAGLEQLDGEGLGPFLIGYTNARRTRDQDRPQICSTIFQFWESRGRSVSYSTNPLTSTRTGPLVEFIIQVTQILTDPAEGLAAETIRKEIDHYQKRKPIEARFLELGL